MVRRVSKKLSMINSSDHQTLPERIRWLRAKQKPFMTQKQLAEIARMEVKTIHLIEKGNMSALNMKLNTLKRIAYALGCRVYITIKSKPSRRGVECQPLDHELPPLPKRTGKSSVQGRMLAELHGRSYQKNYRRRPRPPRQIETSETPDLPVASPEQTTE